MQHTEWIKKDSQFYGSLHYSVRLMCVHVCFGFVFMQQFGDSLRSQTWHFSGFCNWKFIARKQQHCICYFRKSDYMKTFNRTKALAEVQHHRQLKIKCEIQLNIHCVAEWVNKCTHFASTKKTLLINNQNVCIYRSFCSLSTSSQLRWQFMTWF